MEEEKIHCNSCGTSYNKLFLMGKQGNTNICPMCGGEMKSVEDHPDWITWYYYKDPQYGDYSLWDKRPLQPEKLELIKEFKAPPRDSNGSSDKAKEILKTYIPDAFSESEESESSICCPWCGSSEYTLLNRGYSIWTGFLGSGKVKRVCNRCKKEF